jgi:hypothetical protein
MLAQKNHHRDCRQDHQQADQNRESSTKSHSEMGKNDSTQTSCGVSFDRGIDVLQKASSFGRTRLHLKFHL